MNKQIEKEHKSMVKALAKNGSDILVSLTPDKCHLLHMAVGMVGEAAEILEVMASPVMIDRNHLIEELGDYEFYVEGIRSVLDINRQDTLGSRTPDKSHGSAVESTVHTTFLSIESGMFLDLIKKYVIYNKELDVQGLVDKLESLEYYMEGIRFQNNITREETLSHNLNKLLKSSNARYAEGTYTDKQAQTRNDKA